MEMEMKTLKGGDEEQGPRLPPRPATAPDDNSDDATDRRPRLSTHAHAQRHRTVDVEHLRDIVEKQVRTVRRTQLAPPWCT